MMDQIWLGTENSYFAVQQQLAAKVPMPNLSADDKFMGIPNPLEFEVHDGVAVGTISGGLLTSSTWITRLFGITSYEDIQMALAELSGKPEVRSVLLNFDTPGGMAKGCKQCAQFIRAYGETVKPVYTHASDMAASAGLWLYSAGLYHTMDEEAKVGSLGAIMVHSEYTEQRKQEGITDRVFRTAPQKALGHPLEKLSEEAAAQIEADLAELHDKFVAGVSDLSGIGTRKVATQIATGQMFSAEEAKNLGLSDAVLTIGEVVAKMARKYKPKAQAARK